MKKVISFLLAVVCLVPMLSSCAILSFLSLEKETEYYEIVSESKYLLDIVADDIYTYWYDCIYDDQYRGDIDYALECAISDNEENIEEIIQNDANIQSLYSQIKDGRLKAEVKAVMQAYNDYYTLVVEVSGSFNSYSAAKETYKKELASALKDLSFEL